jgi:2C-methyl-D-erythritol 2,4-cyclodiphosphate synthase
MRLGGVHAGLLGVLHEPVAFGLSGGDILAHLVEHAIFGALAPRTADGRGRKGEDEHG